METLFPRSFFDADLFLDLLLSKNKARMISPVLPFLGRLSKRCFSVIPRRLSSKWGDLKFIAPALKSRGKDKYKWMETFNKNTSSRLYDEDCYLKSIVNSCGDISALRQELTNFHEDDYTDSLPYTMHGYSYYNRKSSAELLPLFCRKKIGCDEEEVILNLNTEFPEGSVTVNNLAVSQDSRFLAYTIDTTGEELYNLYIKDLNSGQVEVIQRNVYSFAFGLSNRSHRDIYYSAANSLMRTNRIYRHVLGTSVTHDTLVFEEPSDVYYCDVKRTNDCKYMLFLSASKSDSEIYIQGDRFRSPVLLVKRHEQEECYVEHIQHFFIIVRNSPAQSFEVFLVHEEDVFANDAMGRSSPAEGLIDQCFAQHKVIQLTPPISKASGIIPDSYRIFDMDIMKRHILLYEKCCRGYRIRSLQLDLYDNNLSISEQLFPIDHIGDMVLGTNPDIDSNTITYSLSNPLIRGDTYEYDITRNTSTLIQHLPLPSAAHIDPEQFLVYAESVPSFDGQEIPTVFVAPKHTMKHAPLMLSSYGCYGVDNPIHYLPPLLSLIKRGWILGYPCIRGGGDKGPQWYQQGSRTHRMNGIRDLDCVVGKWCDEHPVCLTSNSAGGIIVGALLNQTNHPIQSVVLHVPFLLLEETLTNRELPLTVTEFDEWGDPSIPEEASGIAKICPYKNIARRNYPNIYCICGINDKRAPYYHSLKYVNKIREFNTNPDSIQVVDALYGGHFCENDPNYAVNCSVQQLAFLLHSVGINFCICFLQLPDNT